MHRRPP